VNTNSDPLTYDYSQATRRCDIVMKGGITSGVVYPLAVCELARVFKLASIGGTSVGAVAAAGAAASEYGRDTGGFQKLAKLPTWLGEGTHLRDLFQPQPGTRSVFRILMAGVEPAKRGRIGAVVTAAFRSFAVATVAGAIPGLVVILVAILASGDGWLRGVALVAGLALALIGAAIALVLSFAREAPKAITANGFGICSGMPTTAGAPPAMTPWLADIIEDLAGRTGNAPLTFGDLEAKKIELTMMTTDLTHRCAQRLPFDDQVYFFDPDEWRALFPDNIVQWMIDHPPEIDLGRADETERVREAMLPRLPFPAPADLPVVVAARMSLSFPVLISAVPLWAFDHTLKANNAALGKNAEPGSKATPEQCWFSDGGISSNFPVHFFDSALPERPTVAIDLDGFHPDHPKSRNEADNVWLPNSNASGWLEAWYRFADKPGAARFLGFLEGIVRTMQNRVDSTLARQPGYRDRIVHVHTDATEGGMNLAMPQQVIDALTSRGQAAGRQLAHRFAGASGTVEDMSWDNHRWVRYRSAMASLGELVEEIADAWDAPAGPNGRSYEELTARGDDTKPSSYRFTSAGQRDLATEFHSQLVTAGRVLRDSSIELETGAPRPPSRARITPRG
jgi:predicted acylesterase/phospholipase RssA